jgi:hypothetical protein
LQSFRQKKNADKFSLLGVNHLTADTSIPSRGQSLADFRFRFCGAEFLDDLEFEWLLSKTTEHRVGAGLGRIRPESARLLLKNFPQSALITPLLRQPVSVFFPQFSIFSGQPHQIPAQAEVQGVKTANSLRPQLGTRWRCCAIINRVYHERKRSRFIQSDRCLLLNPLSNVGLRIVGHVGANIFSVILIAQMGVISALMSD